MSTITLSHQIILTARPTGTPDSSDFSLIERAIDPLKEGEVLLKTLYLSVDPYMRGRMREGPSYIAPFQINQPLIGGSVAEVIDSQSPLLKKNDIVYGFLDWADYSITNAENVRKIDTHLAPISTALGVLGMPGLTAYFGLFKIGQPKPGDTVVISGAAGAVGMTAGQIAKLKGCRVIGIAGGPEKTAFLIHELGFDAAIDYKKGRVKEDLEDLCQKGIDIYFDNVGGEISDLVLQKINKHARIVLCGQISTYNASQPEMGPRPELTLIVRSALMQGFIVHDYQDEYPAGISQLSRWLREGQLKYRETIIEGLENAPKAFIGLFTGQNIGKQLVKISTSSSHFIQ